LDGEKIEIERNKPVKWYTKFAGLPDPVDRVVIYDRVDSRVVQDGRKE